jgi:predicted SAM-dependent methyltransferase
MAIKKSCSTLAKHVYADEGYFRWSTLAGMSQQIIQVHKTKPRYILEIGKGNGFVSQFLHNAGYKITTFDINKNLKPDVVGNILKLDKYFEKNCFDCVLCAEVLEHLPFEMFNECILKINHVTSRDAIITLPRLQKILFDAQLRVSLPRIKPIELGIFLSIPQKKHKIYHDHCWEINSEKATSLKNIREIMQKYFSVQNDFRERWRPYHHFFILRKERAANHK